MMFINVDLPEPDGPMIASISPCSTVSETPRRACTSTSPMLYTLVMSLIAMTGPLFGSAMCPPSSVVLTECLLKLFETVGFANDDPIILRQAFADLAMLFIAQPKTNLDLLRAEIGLLLDKGPARLRSNCTARLGTNSTFLRELLVMLAVALIRRAPAYPSGQSER